MSRDPKITTDLVRALIADQFPAWRDSAVTPVAAFGWDNRTFHLGDDMIVRMPSAERYAMQPQKEWRWLPHLAAHLDLALPAVLGKGRPAHGYPFDWSVLSYLPGQTLAAVDQPDNERLAIDLAGWLRDLRAVPTVQAPGSGRHNFYRGGDLRIYDQELRHSLAQLGDQVDRPAILRVWEKACQSTWTRDPVWVHGDVAPGNFLIQDGRLSAAIDFGACGIGDPSCDLTIAWTYFQGAARAAFRDAVALDEATWARARGWAAWKACLQMTQGAIAADAVLSDLCAEG